MALQDIIQNILNDAIAKSEKIVEQTKADALKIKANETEKLKVRAVDFEKATNIRKADVIKRAEIQAKMIMRSKLTRAKRDLIEEVMNELLDKLQKLSDAEYEKLITGMLKMLPTNLNNACLIIASGKSDLFKKVLKNLNLDYKLEREDEKISGGFIFEADSLVIDNTFNTLVQRELKADLELGVAKVLFG